MTSCHQVLVAAAPGDATTASALEYQRLLREDGPSEIFARYIDSELAGDVRPLNEFAACDRMVFHAAIGDPVVFPFVESRPEPLVVVYHNISPSEPFEVWDPAFARLLADGRAQVAALSSRATMAIAPSQFNAAELRAMGYSDVRVCPLVVEPRVLAPPAGRDRQRPGSVLFVGQLLPHKCIELIVMGISIVATYLDPSVHAVIVGMPRLRGYRDALDALISSLVAPVELLGAVSDSELASHYASAGVFLTASEHEGFCVPVIESMAAGVPVIARGNAALPETLGNAGLLLPGDAGPALLAEAVHRVLRDDELHGRLVAAGQGRVAALDPDSARHGFLDAVRSIAA